jgi:hypothetical protein
MYAVGDQGPRVSSTMNQDDATAGECSAGVNDGVDDVAQLSGSRLPSSDPSPNQCPHFLARPCTKTQLRWIGAGHPGPLAGSHTEEALRRLSFLRIPRLQLLPLVSTSVLFHPSAAHESCLPFPTLKAPLPRTRGLNSGSDTSKVAIGPPLPCERH